MKSLKKTILLIEIVCLFFVASTVFAAEKEGLFQKIRNKLFSKKKASASAQAVKPSASGVKAPEATQKKEAAKVSKPLKDMSDIELVGDIITTIKNLPEVFNFIPELKKEKDAGNEESFTYDGVKLGAGMDRPTLERVWARVHSEAVRVRTERINRQIESIKRHQNLISQPQKVPAIGAAPRVPPAPPKNPAAYQAPKAPSVPAPTKR